MLINPAFFPTFEYMQAINFIAAIPSRSLATLVYFYFAFWDVNWPPERDFGSRVSGINRSIVCIGFLSLFYFCAGICL